VEHLGFRDVADWSILSFTLVMAWPVVLYLQVTSLVSRQPELVTDWRAHFYGQRRWFFGANIILNLLPFGFISLLGGNPLSGAFGAARFVSLGYSVVGFATDNARVHSLIVLTAAVTVVLGFWVPGFSPRSTLP
jgi:hypothetical protein